MTAPARRWWYVAVVAVLVAAGCVGYLVGAGGSSPSDVVVQYLRALAAGDAHRALALGQAPRDRALLTPAVLAEQQRLAPIHDIAVLATDSGGDGAVVTVRYRVGPQSVTDHVVVLRHGSGWVLQHVAVDLELSGAAGLPSPTLFDRAAGAGTDLYVFPGAIRLGSADPNFALVPATAVFTDPDVPAMVSPRAQLSPSGRDTLLTVLRSAMAQCARSRSLHPPRCPQRATRPSTPRLVGPSLRWQAPTRYGDLDITVDSRTPGLVHVSGTLAWTLSYAVRPASGKHAVPRSRTVRSALQASVDFTAQPPALRLG